MRLALAEASKQAAPIGEWELGRRRAAYVAATPTHRAGRVLRSGTLCVHLDDASCMQMQLG